MAGSPVKSKDRARKNSREYGVSSREISCFRDEKMNIRHTDFTDDTDLISAAHL